MRASIRSSVVAVPLLAALVTTVWADTPLVVKGRPQAVIVTSREPVPVASYAATELQYHVAKATGVELPIVTEDAIPGSPAGRVYVGDCEAARKIGIRADGLDPEAFVMRTKGDALYLVGCDSEGSPLTDSTRAGTLFAVYEFLEQTLQVRWLWPGELGEVVPKTDTVIADNIDTTVTQRFFQRHLRHGLSLRGVSGQGFTPQAFKKIAHNLRVWLRRQRMGRSRRLKWGHAFNAYWRDYGADHPEYFQLPEGHARGPMTPRSRYSMCVTNTELHRVIVSRWRRAREKYADKVTNINCCENDINALCVCRNCRSWDGPDVVPITQRYRYRCVSDRYARFWLQVQRLASHSDPDAIVTAYAYVNYAPPPQTDLKLNDHIIIGTVPDIFFPRSPEEHQWVLGQWAGWAKTGVRMFLRPNYFLDGYCMPYVFAHQFADEFAFCINHGMAATDFDSLTSMWATQGPNVYVLARMLVRPQASVDDILSEYYAGFGPAAEHVRAYFEYWERHLFDNREKFREITTRLSANWARFPRKAHELYPPRSIKRGWELLNAATEAAAHNPESAARVEFLRKGLAHAEKCVRVAASMANLRGKISPGERYQAITDRDTYRRETEEDFIANMNFCVRLEERAWGRQRIVAYSGQPLRPLCESVAEADDLPSFPVRGEHGFAVLLRQDEHFLARVRCRKVGRYTSPCQWSLFGPNNECVLTGTVPLGKTFGIDVPVAKAGVHNFIVSTERNVAVVTLWNPHAALLGPSVHFLGTAGPMFVYVPQGMKSFAVILQTPAPGETATLTVTDPNGKVAATGATGGNKRRYAAAVPVRKGQGGRPFGIHITRAKTGVLEDVELTLDKRIPAYWAAAPDRLVVPASR